MVQSIELSQLHIQIISFSAQMTMLENLEMILMLELITLLNQEIIGSLKMLDGVHSQSDLKQIQISTSLLLMMDQMLIKVN